MRIVAQRTKNAIVEVSEKIVGESINGLTLLVCIEKKDSKEIMIKAAAKILNARIFEDSQEKMNLNITQIGGSVLAISQFTLSWRGDKGNRPSFDLSMPPEQAKQLFEEFCHEIAKHVPIQKGEFGASMQVSLTNMGPVTFIFDF